jgi:small subunit ribosomal protein S20
MAHSKQAEKRNRQNQRIRAANKATQTAMKTAMRKVLKAGDSAAAKKSLAEAMKRVDKAAKNRVIHKNAAARYKSHLSKAALASK